MKKMFCSWEKEILESVNRGTLDSEQRDHLSRCSACQESRTVRSWLSDFSRIPDRIESDLTKIPDFESIWQGARAYRGYDRELEKKALKPLLIPQFLTLVAALIGMILLFSSDFNRVKDVVTDKLKMGYLFDLLALVGKKMMALVPYLVIPIIFVLFLIAAHFLYSLFNPKKV
jgi:hypothetical protein